MLRKYPKLFQDPRIDYPIYDMHLPFQDYINQSEKIIATTRQDLNQPSEWIIKNNAPFELRPDNPHPKCGALLIHGLLDSPFIMRDIGHYLQAQGLLVRSIMLPGHSTVPGALLNTTYTDWQQAVTYGIATLKQDVEKIFLVGFSTGANLALCHAMHDPTIRGLILLAPALKINSPFAFLSQWISAINSWDRTKWFCIENECDPVKYQSVTFNAIYQVYELGLNIQKMGPEKLSHCPLFMILSDEDKIVCSRTNIKYFQQTVHPLNRVLLYSGKPFKLTDHRILVRNSRYPDKNILDFCHISLPVAPDNVHYGKKGDYILASHLDSHVKYGALDKADVYFYQLIHQLKLTPFEYQRLTFNPDFLFMQNQIGDFIKQAD